MPAVEWQIVLRATGSDNVLARYARELGSAVTRTLEGAEEDKLWSWISHFEQSVLERHRNAMVLYTHLAIQNVGPALQALQRVAPDYNMIPAAVGRAATGNSGAGIDAAVSGSAFSHAICQLRFRVARDAAAGLVGGSGALPHGSQASL